MATENALAESKRVAASEEPIKAAMLNGLRRIPGVRSLFDLKETNLNRDPRHLYHNVEVPEEELDPKSGYPKAVYASNKVRTTKYTPLNFLPKNILFQFQNLANIYFLAIAILSGFEIFGVNDAGLASVPIIAIVAITAIRDAIEDYRRLVLDMELNNTPTTVLANVPNVNSPSGNVGLWRRFKKACTRLTRRFIFWVRRREDPFALQKMQTEVDSLNTPRASLEAATRPSLESRRSARPSLESSRSKAPKPPKFKRTYWKNVKVGDFVKVYADRGVPADIVIVSTSDKEGDCFIDTRELDGESSLKPRQAVRASRHLRRPRDFLDTQFWLEVEGANSQLQSFGWTLHTSKGDPEALSAANFIPRGSTVRNTAWVLGYVVYTGVETKIMLNAGETPTKRSRITRDMNWLVVFSFVSLFVLSFISGLVEGLKFNSKYNSWRFFEFGLTASPTSLLGFVDFFAAMILLQNIIPISLYISIEIVRTIQAFFIWSDVYMYDETIDYPATPKSWGIGDDLGQIEYIFSDKTGTLTQNKMIFRKLTVGGRSYGYAFTESMAGLVKRRNGDLEAERARASREIKLERAAMREKMKETYINPYIPKGIETELVSADAINDVAGGAGLEQQEAFEQVCLCLALCNTVTVEIGDDGTAQHNAESPDESALVVTARDLGYTLVQTDKASKVIDMRGTRHRFDTLALLAFTSTRKRMAVLVRNEAGRVFVLVKGADSVILERLSPESRASETCSKTEVLMEDYATDGLRVLLMAYREVDPAFAQQWLVSYKAALASPDRERLLNEVSSELETNLTLLGGTGIEDQLQVGVPDTIQTLGQAGIKLWVLTGDKIETAISIGFACNLLSSEMEIMTITDPAQISECLTRVGAEYSPEAMKEASRDHSPASGYHALVVDGSTLDVIVSSPDLQAQFALLGKKCRSVLCCRVSPAQKAAVVFTIKTTFDVTTLAVGDGANDVSMIQVADIGVGIAGIEGRQAAMSADYAIGQFRFLKRLILVHGRYSYHRIAEMANNLLYKNFVFTIVLFWYSIFTQFDESYYFDYTYVTLFNSLFTSFPVVALGILDQDLPPEVLMKHPQLYKTGILRQAFTVKIFVLYVLDGFYQSAVSFFFTYFIFWNSRFYTMNGRDIANRQMVGAFSAHVSVYCCNFYVLLRQYRWDWISIFIVWLSNGLIFGWTGIYTIFIASNFFYNAAAEVYGSLNFWAFSLVGLVGAMLPAVTLKAVQALWFPTDVDIIREQYHHSKYIEGSETAEDPQEPKSTLDVDSEDQLESPESPQKTEFPSPNSETS